MASHDKKTTKQEKLVQFLPVIVLCLFFLAWFAAASPAQEQIPLQGFIEKYALDTKPIDPRLWPGNTFHKDTARALLRDPDQESSIWARIPEWQAGKWEGSQAINTRALKYFNGTALDITPIGLHAAADTFIKGLLKDRKGDIWHWFKSDYWSETDHGDQMTVSYVLYSSPGGGEYPDFYAESIDFNINKASKQILSLRRAKAWTRYTALSPEMIKEETLRTNFDQQGHPSATTFNLAVERRIEPFSTYSERFASRKEVVEDFYKYLRLRGLAGLIPAESMKVPVSGIKSGIKPAVKPAGKPSINPVVRSVR